MYKLTLPYQWDKVRFFVTCLEISFCLVHARIFCFIIARLCKETSDEINRIERRKAMVTKEINKLKNNLQAFKQTGQDVKFLTDRLLHKVVRFGEEWQDCYSLISLMRKPQKLHFYVCCYNMEDKLMGGCGLIGQGKIILNLYHCRDSMKTASMPGLYSDLLEDMFAFPQQSHTM